jgi:N utilization substance protein A
MTNYENMSDLTSAIKQICEEKGLSYEAVLATIESALAAAFRKDFGERNQNIVVEFDPETGGSTVLDVKTVVEDMPAEEVPEDDTDGKIGLENKEDTDNTKSKKLKVESRKYEKTEDDEEGEEEERKFNAKTELQITDAKLIKKNAKVGDVIKTKLEIPSEFGRMAAQTAKQVIIQRLREAERETIFNDFKDKEREVVSGLIQRREGRVVLVDLGKAVGILTSDEQIMGERYNPGERIKVYVKEVRMGSKGPEIILSRTSDEILKKVFYLEIPEISNGLVELKSVAREAGSRSKVAVSTDSENVDPIGSCVGQRGSRIQTIIQELGGEKVDIIEYSDDQNKFIENALSPAKIIGITLNNDKKEATIRVAADQLSLAIGKSGQNARLAARLTGWKIDIVENKESSSAEASEDKSSPSGDTENKSASAEVIESKLEEKVEDKNKEEGVSEEKKEKPKKEKKEKKEKKSSK